MPLGFFSSNSNKDSGPKPEPLKSEKDKKFKDVAQPGAGADIKDAKGTTVKLSKKHYGVEKKLAEGGYAIVYLVQDKHNRCYALKRQLIRDDQRQVEACKTEAQIVKNLNGHKNIVGYVDHSLSVNKAGIYDYMLLTVYYKSNVLQLMNSRLLAGKWLTVDEILAILCDVCEAVARLHHSKTPVIHRDLKVENILIDERTGGDRPNYVLCDFGSATTKVMSRDSCTQTWLEEEIKKYTTPAYRAPEMIDLFSNTPIDTKSDIWALGVLLYKLCYFALPFGDSVLAIQNGSFTFPDQPAVPDEVKAIINLLLTASAKHRPNIYQASYLAFSAAKQKCPVYNIEKCPRIELQEAVEIYRLRGKLGADYARRLEKALNEFEEQKQREKQRERQAIAQQVAQQRQSSNLSQKAASTPPHEFRAPDSREGMIVDTNDDRTKNTTTSVNPRLRPKPSANVSAQFLTGVTTPNCMLRSPNTADTRPYTPTAPPDQPGANPGVMSASAGPVLVPTTPQPKLAHLGGPSTSVQEAVRVPALPPQQQHQQQPSPPRPDPMKVSQISTDSAKSAPDHQHQQQQPHSNAENAQPTYQRAVSNLMADKPFSQAELCAQPRARNAATLPATALRSSAFQPYSMAKSKQESEKALKATSLDMTVRTTVESSNPFASEIQASIMDDKDFGERFDQIRRVNRRNTVVSTIPERRVELIERYQRLPDPATFCLDPVLERAIEEDPFGSAPILPSQIMAPKKPVA